MEKPKTRRVLRVGLLSDGRIIEERLMRGVRTVTLGQSPRCTFVLTGEGVPRSATLFECSRGRWWLTAPTGTPGRLAAGDAVRDLGAIGARDPKLSRRGTYAVPLPEGSRGRLRMGDVTVLFQFVAPPLPAPRLRLPAAARGGWVKSIDWSLVLVLLLSAVLQAGAVAALVAQDWPESSRRTAVPGRFVDLVLPRLPAARVEPPGPEPAPAPPATSVVPSRAPKPRPAQPSPEQRAEDEARAQSEHKRDLAGLVRDKTLIKQIGALAEGGGGLLDAVMGGAARSRLDDAFESTGGRVAMGLPGQERSLRGQRLARRLDETGPVATVGPLEGPARRGALKGVGPREEVRLRTRVAAGAPIAPIGSGRLDRAALATVVRRGLRGVRSCYERALKRQPSLSGKLSVRFTVGAAGRVTQVDVVGDTLGSEQVARCVAGRVRRWRFPPPAGGELTVAYPFVFTRAD